MSQTLTFNQIFNYSSKVGMEIERQNKDVEKIHKVLKRNGLIWNRESGIYMENGVISEIKTEPVNLQNIADVIKLGVIIESFYHSPNVKYMEFKSGERNILGESNHLNVGIAGIRKYGEDIKYVDALLIALNYMIFPFGVRLLLPRDSRLLCFGATNYELKTVVVNIKSNYIEYRFNENPNLYQAYIYPLLTAIVYNSFTEKELSTMSDEVYDLLKTSDLAEYPRFFVKVMKAKAYEPANMTKVLERFVDSLKNFIKRKRNLNKVDKYLFDILAKTIIDNIDKLYSLHRGVDVDKFIRDYKVYKYNADKGLGVRNKAKYYNVAFDIENNAVKKYEFVKAKYMISKALAEGVLEVFGEELKQFEPQLYTQIELMTRPIT